MSRNNFFLIADLKYALLCCRESLQSEVRLLDSDRDHVAGDICWNHADFQVQYQSLQKEIQIGGIQCLNFSLASHANLETNCDFSSGYYLRLLLEEDAFDASFEIQNAKDFFADLYHRFLLTGRSDMRGMCLQALTTVYGRHWQEIGVFTDLKYIVIMLEKVIYTLTIHLCSRKDNINIVASFITVGG